MHRSRHHASRYVATLSLVVAALLLSALQGAFASVVTIDPEGGRHELGTAAAWLRDAQGILGIHEIVSSPDFITDDEAPSFGYTTDTVWLKLSLKQERREDIDWVLDLSPAFLDKIDVYRVEDGNIIDVAALGDHRPWHDGDWRWRHSAILVRLPDNTPATYYFRIQSSSSVAFNPVLYRSDIFPKAVTAQVLVLAVATASGLMTMALALLFFLLLRDRLYLYLFLYVLAFTYCVAMFEGLLHFTLRPDSPVMLEWLQVLLQSIGAYALFRFTSLILELPTHLPRSTRIADYLVKAISITGVLLMLAGHYQLSIPLLWLAIATLCLATPVVAFALAPRIGLTAYLYGTTFAVIALGSFFRFSWIFGASSPTLISETNLPVGMFLHILLLFIILPVRYITLEKTLRSNNELALQRISETGEQLQRLVAEKTDQLNNTNARLSDQLLESHQQRKELERTRDRLNTALQEEKKALFEQRRFMRMVAHEFRTPLAVIGMANELISTDPAPANEQVKRNCERIQAASERMASLINQALREDRLDSIDWRKNAAPVQVSDLLRSAVSYGEMVSAGRHAFSLEMDDDLQISSDQELLLTALNNIVDNAVKYSPAGTRICIGALQAEDDSVQIHVRDQGRGMSKQEVAEVLQKYFRAQSSEGIPGMGLGLYLVDRIIRLHNAELVITSEPGQGTCFTIVFSPAPANQIRKA
jgi:signal transduction histidine kinase